MSRIANARNRSPLRGRPTTGAPTLVPQPSTLIVGLMCFAFFAGIATVSNVVRNKTTTWWTTTIFVGFALRWSDLRAVRYAPLVKWFRLETHSGEVARISVMLTGVPDFARTLLARAPGGAVDADTLLVL